MRVHEPSLNAPAQLPFLPCVVRPLHSRVDFRCDLRSHGHQSHTTNRCNFIASIHKDWGFATRTIRQMVKSDGAKQAVNRRRTMDAKGGKNQSGSTIREFRPFAQQGANAAQLWRSHVVVEGNYTARLVPSLDYWILI